MGKSFLEFINEKRKIVINESFNTSDIDKAIVLINKMLKRHISGLVPLVGYVNTTVDGAKCMSKQYMVVDKQNPENACMFQLNWTRDSETSNVYSIDFFNDLDILFDGKSKTKLTIYTLGSSIVYFLPIIWTVISSGNYHINAKQAEILGAEIYKDVEESLCYIGALEYKVYENLSDTVIKDTFKLVTEGNADLDDDAKEFKKEKRAQAMDAYGKRKDSEEAAKKNKELWDEYKKITDAIKGGATTLDEIKMAMKHGVTAMQDMDKGSEECEEELKKTHEDPELTFKKMNKYVGMVIKGTNTSVILCGAPGVGKTYNVKKQLKASGYMEGHNMCTIKGKCTPRTLYLRLYEYQDKGQVLLIDDADSLVGPKAPEDSINILKAALDSTSDDDGRLVSYGVSGKLLDDEGDPIPKKFYYNGSVIVITNWNAGNLDTALKGRSFVQDIHFTVEDTLAIIKKLMPGIDPEHLSVKSKIKAYDYLLDLANKKTDMEISIRTFGICAKIFETAQEDDDFTDEEAKSMIGEQMKLQATRRGKKY